MRTAALVTLLLLTAGAAGCIGGDGSEDDAQTASEDAFETETNDTEANETPEEELGPTITTSWKNASWQGAQTGGLYYCHPPITLVGECDNEMAFLVNANATTVVAEISWEGEADVFFRVLDQANETVASEQGSSPLQLVVEDGLPSEEVEWRTDAWVDATTPTQVDATFAVSVVEGGELPDGFARLAQT